MASSSSSAIAAGLAIDSKSIVASSRGNSPSLRLRWRKWEPRAPPVQVSFSRSLARPRNWDGCGWRQRRMLPGIVSVLGEQGEESSVAAIAVDQSDLAEKSPSTSVDEGEGRVLTPEEEEDQECVDQILRVLELLKINRDMTPNEVRLIVMIEDPRDSENRGMLTEDGEWTSVKDEMGNALIDISEGRIPREREILRALRDELVAWPNLDEMADNKDPRKSSYAELTDTGVDPVVSGQRAKVDWDEAAEIVPGQEKDISDKVPPAVGYSLLYLVSLLPILIGIAVVAILFINSFQ